MKSMKYTVMRILAYFTKGKIKALPTNETDCIHYSKFREKPIEISAELIEITPLHDTHYLKDYYGKFNWTFQNFFVKYEKRYASGNERQNKKLARESEGKLERDIKKIEKKIGIKVASKK